MATSANKISKKGATIYASKIFADKNVRSRLNWLRENRFLEAQKQIKNELSGEDSQKTLTLENPPTQNIEPENLAGREEINAALSKAIKSAKGAELTSAITAYLKLNPSLQQDTRISRPDPENIIAFVASFAGMDGSAIMDQLGGETFVASKLCAVLRRTPSQMRDLFQSIVQQ